MLKVSRQHSRVKIFRMHLISYKEENGPNTSSRSKIFVTVIIIIIIYKYTKTVVRLLYSDTGLVDIVTVDMKKYIFAYS